MKNKIVNFDTEIVDLGDDSVTYEIPDYFSKDIHISDLESTYYDTWSDYMDTYRMQDNDKLERVSYELYGTTDYWDILFLLNDRDPLFDMPFDYDTLSETSSNFIDAYVNDIYNESSLNDARVNALTEEVVNEAIQNNETYRYITVVKPSKISDFIILLKDEGYV